MPFGAPKLRNQDSLTESEVKALCGELMFQCWPHTERGEVARIAHIKLQRFANRDLSLVPKKRETRKPRAKKPIRKAGARR